MSARTGHIPVVLLTGFLGSGKTTVLRGLLANPDFSGTAVIVNEYGEIGLDHLLMGSTVFEPILLPNGCLCCTSRGELSASLQSLSRQDTFKNIRRIVVETTGLANPIPLLQVLATDPAICARFRLGGVVTTVDCVNGAATLSAYEEAVCQVAVADRLLVTKTDLASAKTREVLRGHISTINPDAQSVDIVSGGIEPSDIAGLNLYDVLQAGENARRWIGLETREEHRHDPFHSQRIGTFNFVRERPLPWAAFVDWMEMLATVRGEDLLRIKGIVNVADWPDEPVVIHGVQHVFHPPVRLQKWPDDDRRTRIVFITRGIDRQKIDATLHLLGD